MAVLLLFRKRTDILDEQKVWNCSQWSERVAMSSENSREGATL